MSAPLDELIEAAFQVAKEPTVVAYRSPYAFDKKIGRTRLLRLMKALTPYLDERGQGDMLMRIQAIEKAENR